MLMLKPSALAADICIGSVGGNRSKEAGPASIVICENAVMVRAEGQRGALGPRLGVPSQYHFAATELTHPGQALRPDLESCGVCYLGQSSGLGPQPSGRGCPDASLQAQGLLQEMTIVSFWS